MCGEIQWSLMEKAYCILYGVCWSEDKEQWEKGKLDLAVFENREKQALDYSMNVLQPAV